MTEPLFVTTSSLVIRPHVGFAMARRPETPEDALALLQAFWDVRDPGSNGLMFYASEPAAVAKLDANPMLRRTPSSTTGDSET